MSIIKEQLDLIHHLSEETFSKLLQLSTEIEIPKGDELSCKGSHGDYEIFLLDGIVRTYVVTNEFKEYTISFYEAGSFISPAFTRNIKNKNSIHIQALAKCKALLFKESEFTKLRYEHEDLLVLGRNVVERELLSKSQKEVILATQNLKILYQFFQNTFPSLESKISQRHIASYLGVDPVSLSRIRSELMK